MKRLKFFSPTAIENIYARSVRELAKTSPLTQEQFDALISISYNRGQNFLSENNITGGRLVRLIKERKMKDAADFIRTGLDSSDLENQYLGITNYMILYPKKPQKTSPAH